MRVSCAVVIVNQTFGHQGMSLRRKAIRSTISIIKKNGDTMLMICTTKHPGGNLYKLKCNIERVFTRMSGKGMVTVRLKDPQIDIQISEANSEEVSRLVKALKFANQGQSLLGLGVLSTSEPMKKKSLCKGPVSMKVTSRAEYPVLGFPSSLQQLTVDGCQLKKFDSRMLRLRCLTSLALVNNKIDELPNELADMTCLTDLHLESNNLTMFPSALCELTSKLCSTLTVLVLNNNRIRYLPDNIGNLSKLTSLHINNNILKFIPYDIGRLKNLKFLFARGNKLLFVPFSVRKLSLSELDVSQNQFVPFGSLSIINRLTSVPTLQDLACKVILKEKISFKEENVNLQCRHLMGKARKCVFCPNLVFRSYIRMPMKFDLSLISETVMHGDSIIRKSAPLDVYMCSSKCFNRCRLLTMA